MGEEAQQSESLDLEHPLDSRRWVALLENILATVLDGCKGLNVPQHGLFRAPDYCLRTVLYR